MNKSKAVKAVDEILQGGSGAAAEPLVEDIQDEDESDMFKEASQELSPMDLAEPEGLFS